jgi:hypothetical protein
MQEGSVSELAHVVQAFKGSLTYCILEGSI